MASWVMQMMSATGYIGLVLLMVLENVFPPIPSEVIMPLAGFMVAQDRLSLLGVIVAGTLPYSPWRAMFWVQIFARWKRILIRLHTLC
jgi:membrane protein DedA with SNARE-associated domain